MRDQWYESASGENSGWYEPAIQSPTSVPAPAPRRRRGWLVATLIILGILVLIMGSALLFGSRGAGQAAELPGLPELPEDKKDSDFAGDFREFFENYYTPQEQSEECTIPRVESFSNRTMRLIPAGDHELTLHEVYEKCAPSVVAVTAYIEENSDDRYYWGTGIILTQDGYIVTNSHVVEGSCRGKVTLWDDREYEVRLVGNDSRSDIAVLKIEATGLTPAEFCDTESLRVGDRVVAIGNPLGDEFRSTMTEGIISGIDRDISYNGTTLTLLQTSAPINEGNSGGPLINMFGQVIGITNMKMSNGAGAVSIEGVGFAIPSKTVKTMADSILSCGEVLGRPALGLTLGPIPDTAMSNYELPAGLYISKVSDGSDCKAQGIKEGEILTAVNGKSVTTTAQVLEEITQRKVGDTLELTIWRSEGGGKGSTYQVTVKLVDVNDVY